MEKYLTPKNGLFWNIFLNSKWEKNIFYTENDSTFVPCARIDWRNERMIEVMNAW